MPRWGVTLFFLALVSPTALAQSAKPLALAGSPPASLARQIDSETERNRIVMEQFADVLYRQKEVRRAFETYAAPGYIQHSPMLADGLPAVIAALEPKFGNPAARFTVKKLIVDGDYAVLMIHAESPGHQGAVVDIYRLSEGKLVEHWDVGRDFPDHPVSDHPLF